MDVFFEQKPGANIWYMYVRLAPGVFMDRDEHGYDKVVDVKSGDPAPAYWFLSDAVKEAMERTILENSGIADELRDRLADMEEQRQMLWEEFTLANASLRKIAERS